MTIDERYASIPLHDQDQPNECTQLFLQPGTLLRAGLVPGCRVMQVRSNDMAGYASAGDMVIYNPGVKWISTGSDVYVLRVQGRYVLRRAERTLRGEIVLTDEAGSAQESFKGDAFTSEPKHAEGLIFVVGRVLVREVASRG